MLIIWRGFGWLVPVIVFASILLFQLALDSMLGDGYYQQNTWPVYAALTLSSLIIGVMGFALNSKNRFQKKHALFFIPVEFWAIITPALFIWVLHSDAEKTERELAYANAPEINDIYLADLSKLFELDDAKFKYGAMKVVEVIGDDVLVVVSLDAYDGKSGPRKDYTSGDLKQPGYYAEESVDFSVAEIVDLKSDKTIYQIYR